MKTEIWITIKNYPRYQVSNLGRVKRLAYTHKGKSNSIVPYKEKILKQNKDGNGYFFVHFCMNYKHKNYHIHRLLAENFILNPQNKREVNHIDGNKNNNNIDNLEWCSRSDNMKHAHKMGLIKNTMADKAHHNKCLILAAESHYKPVICYNNNQEFKSITEAANSVNISIQALSSHLTNKTKTCAGMKWGFK